MLKSNTRSWVKEVTPRFEHIFVSCIIFIRLGFSGIPLKPYTSEEEQAIAVVSVEAERLQSGQSLSPEAPVFLTSINSIVSIFGVTSLGVQNTCPPRAAIFQTCSDDGAIHILSHLPTSIEVYTPTVLISRSKNHLTGVDISCGDTIYAI